MEEPDKDKSLRGSRDGFVETIVFNTALMRRRIRDEHLIMEMTEAGQTSRTDIVICYMSDRVDKELLANVKIKDRKPAYRRSEDEPADACGGNVQEKMVQSVSEI